MFLYSIKNASFFSSRERLTGLSLLFVVIGCTSLLSEGSAPNTAGLASTIRRGESVVDVLLRCDSYEKRGRVAELLTNSNVSLADQNARVVNGLGQTALEHLSLEASLEHLLAGHGECIIELPLVLIEETHSDELSQEGLTLELSGLVVLLESEQVTRSRSDLGQSVHHSPDFSLVLEPVLTHDSQLGIQTRLLVGSSRSLGSLRVVAIVLSHL